MVSEIQCSVSIEEKKIRDKDGHSFRYIYIYTAIVDKFNSFDLTLISFHLRTWTREDAARERQGERERMKRNRVFFRAYNCLIDKCVCMWVCGTRKEKGALFELEETIARRNQYRVSPLGCFGSLLCNVNAQQMDLSTSIASTHLIRGEVTRLPVNRCGQLAGV